MKSMISGRMAIPVSVLIASALLYSGVQAADDAVKRKGGAVRPATGAADTTKGKVEEDRTRFSEVRLQSIESRLAAVEKDVKSLRAENSALRKENEAMRKVSDAMRKDLTLLLRPFDTQDPNEFTPIWINFPTLNSALQREEFKGHILTWWRRTKKPQ